MVEVIAHPREDWTAYEIAVTVRSYLAMLESDESGESYNKAAANRELRTLIPARSRSAIEFKHQNISAVLDADGMIFIRGYKPMRNVQRALTLEVRRQVHLKREAL